MEATLIQSIQTSFICRIPAAVGVYKGEVVVSTPDHCSEGSGCSQNDVTVWFHQLHGSTSKCIHLTGHSAVVNVLAFSSPPHTLLCSGSEEEVLLWDLEHCIEQHASGRPCGSRQLDFSASRETVGHIYFSQDSQYVALCRGQETLVFDTKTCLLDTTLVGHTARVTCAVFSIHSHQPTIITASEDRTFKVWDLANSSLIYQSPIISASPFLCVTVALHSNLLATGTADGVVRIYDLSEGQGRFACLYKCDVAKELEKLDGRNAEGEAMLGSNVIHSTPSWKQSHVGHMSEDGTDTSVEMSPTILNLYYWPLEQQPHTVSSETHISEVLKDPPILVVVTHQGLLQFNGHTLELMGMIDFREPLKTSRGLGHGHTTIPAVASCDFVYSPLEGEVYCALGALFNGSVMVLNLTKELNESGWENVDTGESTEHSTVSVLSSTPLIPSSPLKAEFSLKSKVAPTTKRSNTGRGTSCTAKYPHDQPLTFKSKIKSSGYSEAPRMKMFTPKTKGAAASVQKSDGATLGIGSKLKPKNTEYPVSCEPTTHPFHTMRLSERHSTVYDACFSGSGQYLACACADKVCYAVKMPPQLEKAHAFVGQDGAVLSNSWSHSGQWLLTSSADRTARVWSVGHKDPLLSITTVMSNFKGTEKDERTQAKINCQFAKEISRAQFYYLDKFFVLTSGNTLYLYKYHIDTTKPDDVKRYQSNSRYKLVTSFAMESAKSITAMSSINDFHSYIFLLGGSNKELEVYDMNVERSVRTMTEVHGRSVHCIYQNKGSKYVTHPPNAYDLFITSAVTDGIKLWDLRTNRCVHKFSSHSNPSLPLSAAISPCARFIATGSEDRAAYIYDIRSASPLHKLRGHSDVVSCVAYHPLKSILATTTLDGQVKLFDSQSL